MSNEEAWRLCEDAFWTAHTNNCVALNCGCEEMIEEVKGALNV